MKFVIRLIITVKRELRRSYKSGRWQSKEGRSEKKRCLQRQRKGQLNMI